MATDTATLSISPSKTGPDVRYSAPERLNAVRRRNKETEVFRAQLRDVIGNQFQLPNRVESCLAIGAGSGDLELEFIQHYMPDLRTLIAIEPDYDSANVLRSRLDQRMPNVALEVFPGKVEDWDGFDRLDHSVDMVLMLHVLYYVSASERPRVCTSLFQKVVKSGGFVATLLIDFDYIDKLSGVEVLQQLDPERMDLGIGNAAATQLMTSAGFVPYYEHTYAMDMNTAGIEDDEGFLAQLHHYAKPDVSFEQLRQSLAKAFGGATAVPDGRKFVVFKKP